MLALIRFSDTFYLNDPKLFLFRLHDPFLPPPVCKSSQNPSWSYITSAVWCRILQCLSLVIAVNVKAEHSQNDKMSMSQILSSKSCEIWRHRKVNSWSRTSQKNIWFHRLLKIVSSNKILLVTYKPWSSVSKSELWDPRWPQLILLKHRHVVLCQSAFLYIGIHCAVCNTVPTFDRIRWFFFWA